MALTEKGFYTLNKIKEFYPTGDFTAKELSEACGERIYAATLNGIVNNGYLSKTDGTPALYALIDVDIEADKVTSKQTNAQLLKAKKGKKDEFYTRYEDISAEVMHYRKYFEDKIVYLPCDDPAEKLSDFWSFFLDNFDDFGLKKLIATHYDENGKAYKIWVEDDINGDGYIDDEDVLQEDLEGNGDFRSDECTKILEESDIVVTNPPFSQFRDFVDWIMKANKKCLIIGNNNALSYQEIFRLIKENRLWVGYTANKNMDFRVGEGYKYDPKLTAKYNDGHNYGTVPAVSWFTNLPCNKRNEELILTVTYDPTTHPKYDNYDAIECGKYTSSGKWQGDIKMIPKDYDGVMGVPVTFLNIYNPNQFKIIGIMATTKVSDTNFGYPYINGKKTYARVLIKHK